jgi:hypothetical protein
MRKKAPSEVFIGAGTVRRVADVEAVAEARSDPIVTPHADPCREAGDGFGGAARHDAAPSSIRRACVIGATTIPLRDRRSAMSIAFKDVRFR